MNAGCVQVRALTIHKTRFEHDMHQCAGVLHDPSKLKESFKRVYETYNRDSIVRLQYMKHVDESWSFSKLLVSSLVLLSDCAVGLWPVPAAKFYSGTAGYDFH